MHLHAPAPPVTFNRTVGRHRRRARWPISLFGLARIALFVLIALHVVHLPVLAHEEHVRVPEPTSVGQVDGDLAVHADEHTAMDHTHGSGASLPDRGGSEAHLAGHGDDDLECMTTAATIPTQAATPVALTLPAEIPAGTADGFFKPTSVVAHSAEPARRHLVLQVLLR